MGDDAMSICPQCGGPQKAAMVRCAECRKSSDRSELPKIAASVSPSTAELQDELSALVDSLPDSAETAGGPGAGDDSGLDPSVTGQAERSRKPKASVRIVGRRMHEGRTRPGRLAPRAAVSDNDDAEGDDSVVIADASAFAESDFEVTGKAVADDSAAPVLASLPAVERASLPERQTGPMAASLNPDVRSAVVPSGGFTESALAANAVASPYPAVQVPVPVPVHVPVPVPTAFPSPAAGAPSEAKPVPSHPAEVPAKRSQLASRATAESQKPQKNNGSSNSRSISDVEHRDSTADMDEGGSVAESVDNEAISVSCQCGARMRVPQSAVGRKKRCRKCKAVILIKSSDQMTGSADLPAAIDAALKLPGAELEPLGHSISSGKLSRLKRKLNSAEGQDDSAVSSRRGAVLELGETKDSRVTELIAPLATDPEVPVREAVAEAIANLGDPEALAVALRLLDDREQSVALQAVRALKRIGDPRAVRPLLMAGHVAAPLKPSALDCVRHMGESAVPGLLTVMQEPEGSLQADAAIALGRIRDKRAVPVLLEALQSGSPPLRIQALEALGQIGDKKALPQIAAHLKSADSRIRLAAVQALQRMPDRRTTGTLIELLKESQAAERKSILATLGASGDPKALPAIIALIPDADEALQESIADALAGIDDPRCGRALCELLQDGDEPVQLKAISSLRKLGSPEAIPEFNRLLRHPTPTLRRQAVEALADHPGHDVEIEISELLENDVAPEVRAAAARALGRLGDTKAVPLLEDALNDEASVRCAAVIALGALETNETHPALMAMLRDSVPEVRYHAVTALGRMKLEQAVPGISKLLEDPDKLVRTAVKRALDSMEVSANIPLGRRFKCLLMRFMPDFLASLLPRNPGIVFGGAAAVIAAVVATTMLFRAALTPSIVMRGNVIDLRFNSAGDKVAVLRRGALEIWDLSSSSIQAEVASSSGQFVGFSGSADRVLVFRDGNVIPWSPGELAIDPESALGIEGKGIRSLGLSADGAIAVSVFEASGRVWDTDSGESIDEFSVSPLGRVVVSGDGQFFAEFVQKFKKLRFGRFKGDSIQEIQLEADGVTAMALNHDGSRLAMCLNSKTVLILNLSDPDQETAEIELEHSVTAAALSAAGDILWMGHQVPELTRLDLKSGQSETISLEDDDVEEVQTVRLSSDGARLAAKAASKKVWIVDTASKSVTALSPPPVQ